MLPENLQQVVWSLRKIFADSSKLNIQREQSLAGRVFHWTYKAVLNASAIYLYGMEFTQMRTAEEQRHQVELQLNASHRMDALGQLAGNVAHDFNNILSAISGYAQLLQVDLADKKV
tara:strand:+ start:199 stop:549 length:351 start_codon:yes stop_codon:yes gene_type:complete